MKPLKLTMQGFGPYADLTTIDFEALTRGSQLYLITGDTGAGKTMIFDAISYALFGSDSGKIRDENELRSSFVSPEVDTEVKLWFEHKGKTYKIKRGERFVSNKGDHKKLLAQSVGYVELKELYDGGEDHVLASQTSKVRAEIQSILGMDQDQFEQVSMIAQGQFRKMLSASTDERKKLLTQLFRTEKFGRLNDELKNKLSEEKANIDSILAKIQSAQEGIRLEAGMDPEEQPELRELVDENSLKMAVDSLSFLTSEEETRYKEQKSKVKVLDNRLDKLQEESGKLQPLAKIQKDLNQKKSGINDMEEAARLANEAWAKAEQNKSVIEKLKSEISVKKNRLSDYDTLDKQNEKLRQNQKKQGDLEKKLTDKKQQINQKTASLQSLEKEKADKQNAGSEKGKTDQAILSLQNQRKQYAELSQKLNKAHEQRKTYDDAVTEFGKAKQAEARQNEIYRDARDRYYGNQAGILAEAELKEGELCPVCGSREHPHPAVKDPNAPTKEQLEAEEKQWRKLEEEYTAASGTAKAEKALLDQEIRDFQAEWKEIGEQLLNGVPKVQWREVLTTKVREFDKQIQALKDSSRTLAEDVERYKELDTRTIPNNRAKLETFQKDQNVLNRDLASLKAAEEQLIQQVATLQSNLSKNSRAEADEEIAALTKRQTTLQTELDTAEKDKREKEKALAEVKTQIASYEERLKAEEYDPAREEQVQQELQAMQAEKDSLTEETTQLHERLTANESALKKLKELKEQFIAGEQEQKQVNELSVIANGSKATDTNEGKVSFDTYVLQSYFDQVLSRASARLYTMSGKHYRLKRRSHAKNRVAKTGLDIDVHDCFNGVDRHAETLSGGESFLASMALALAFSDVVQEHAGGVKIDSLFIDEGFGTLDEGSLNNAVRTLQDLAGDDRTVAVISHVSELQEKMENQLIVERNQGESSTVKIRTPETGN